jgi:hypothetical protein
MKAILISYKGILPIPTSKKHHHPKHPYFSYRLQQKSLTFRPQRLIPNSSNFPTFAVPVKLACGGTIASFLTTKLNNKYIHFK